MIDVDDYLLEKLKFCNCAGCAKELLGDSWKDWYFEQDADLQRRLPPPVAGRLYGRPYCDLCLSEKAARLKSTRTWRD